MSSNLNLDDLNWNDFADDDLNLLEKMSKGANDLKELIESTDFKWIFVGGKGGVGKTTLSSSIALLIAEHKKKTVGGDVLIISTDPAHNLSDAFAQKFCETPRKVEGTTNLYAMEISPKLDIGEDQIPDFLKQNASKISEFVSDVGSSLPGIDEIVSFLEIMRQVRDMKYETIIFDTAPTGHTLRLLSMPQLLKKSVGQLANLNIGQLGSSLGSLMGLPSSGSEIDDKIKKSKELVDFVADQFKSENKKTTFVCVCIPEFLSVYETERLVQELVKNDIHTGNIIVNQLVFPSKTNFCELCHARKNIQFKYLQQIFSLYETFNIVQMPLLGREGFLSFFSFIFFYKNTKNYKKFQKNQFVGFQNCLNFQKCCSLLILMFIQDHKLFAKKSFSKIYKIKQKKN